MELAKNLLQKAKKWRKSVQLYVSNLVWHNLLSNKVLAKNSVRVEPKEIYLSVKTIGLSIIFTYFHSRNTEYHRKIIRDNIMERRTLKKVHRSHNAFIYWTNLNVMAYTKSNSQKMN